MNRFQKVFDIDLKTLMKISAVLIILFLFEIILWRWLNFYHKPEEIALGDLIAFPIFIATCIFFFALLRKENYLWLVIIVIHIIGLYFINRVTMEHGFKRYLDSIQETWKFEHNATDYLIKLHLKNESLTIYIESPEHLNLERFNPIVSGQSIKLEKGWGLSNDTLNIKIEGQKVIGFPTELDTLEIKKIYF